MEEQKWKYTYDGPVLVFGQLVQSNFRGETIATSSTKARSNLVYQWKKRNGRSAGSKVELPGKIILKGYPNE